MNSRASRGARRRIRRQTAARIKKRANRSMNGGEHREDLEKKLIWDAGNGVIIDPGISDAVQ